MIFRQKYQRQRKAGLLLQALDRCESSLTVENMPKNNVRTDTAGFQSPCHDRELVEAGTAILVSGGDGKQISAIVDYEVEIVSETANR